MRLKDLDFIQLLPVFMKKDPAVQALASVMTQTLADPDEHLKDAATWNRIEKLSEPELDDLAWEFDVDWYDCSASKEVKISQIKSAVLIKKRRGTKWAVEQILRNIIGRALVNEWMDYGGDPYHFEVAVKNPTVTQEMYSKLIQQIEKAKNVRSVLDRIYYLDEKKIDIEASEKLHPCTFTLERCGIPYCGRFKALTEMINRGSPLATECNVIRHSGTFTYLRCGIPHTGATTR